MDVSIVGENDTWSHMYSESNDGHPDRRSHHLSHDNLFMLQGEHQVTSIIPWNEGNVVHNLLAVRE